MIIPKFRLPIIYGMATQASKKTAMIVYAQASPSSKDWVIYAYRLNLIIYLVINIINLSSSLIIPKLYHLAQK